MIEPDTVLLPLTGTAALTVTSVLHGPERRQLNSADASQACE